MYFHQIALAKALFSLNFTYYIYACFSVWHAKNPKRKSEVTLNIDDQINLLMQIPSQPIIVNVNDK